MSKLTLIKGRIQRVTRLVLWSATLQIALSFPAQVLLPEPLPLSQSFNRSPDARWIDVPAASFLSKRDLSWADAVAKGTRLLCRLENPALLDDQSSVSSVGMLAASGWSQFTTQVDSNIFPDFDSYFAQEGIVNNLEDCVSRGWRHSRESKNSQGEDVPATLARYQNVYNPKAGFIVAYHNFGPSFMVRSQPIKTLPDVRAWSDVTFVEWKIRAQASSQDIMGLKYVLRYEIVNQQTISIIKQVAGILPSITWPGLIIPMSDERGRAILGTPNGVGVAYLLATHKAQLGEKTIESVHVWSRQVITPFEVLDEYLFAAFKIGPVASSSGPSTAT